MARLRMGQRVRPRIPQLRGKDLDWAQGAGNGQRWSERSLKRDTTMNSSCRATRRKPQARFAPLQGSWTGAPIRYRMGRSVSGARRPCLRLPASGGLSCIGVHGSETRAQQRPNTRDGKVRGCILTVCSRPVGQIPEVTSRTRTPPAVRYKPPHSATDSRAAPCYG